MSRRRAFTLVELLVVIAIICILIAVLLPCIKKVKLIAERVACASNMRQVGQAFLAYANDNRGSFPGASRWGQERGIDWIHWQAGRKLSESRIWPYIGKSDAVLRCPAGVIAPFEYPYSYAVSIFIAGLGHYSGCMRANNHRVCGCKLSEIRNPAEKLLIVEPSTRVIGDGCWWGAYERENPGGMVKGEWPHELLSTRHDGIPDRDPYISPGTIPARNFANVIFADGHHAFVRRWTASESQYCYPRNGLRD